MLKFDFSVQTRNGQKVDSVVIAGKDQQDAERKLRQMYHHCSVISCVIKQSEMRDLQAMSCEDLLTAIAHSDVPERLRDLNPSTTPNDDGK